MESSSRIASNRFSWQSIGSLTGIRRTLRRTQSTENLRNAANGDHIYPMVRRSSTRASTETTYSKITETQEANGEAARRDHTRISNQGSSTYNTHRRPEIFTEDEDEPGFPRRMIILPSVSHQRSSRISHRRSVIREVWVSLIFILVPMFIIPIIFAILVAKYKVQSEPSLFSGVRGARELQQKRYILLRIPATWVVFISSRASQIASLLAGPIMTLWTWRATRSLLLSSSEARAVRLPTPYQLSLLVGLCLSSMDTLWDYIVYRHFRPRRIREQTPISPVLLRVGLIFYLALCLSGSVLVADTVLHYTTSTIELDDISRSNQLGESGRGLSEECLQLSRNNNSGYPCSRNIGLSVSEPNAYLREQNEMFYLRHNTSQTSEIRLVPAQGSDSTDVVLLIPKSSTLSPFVDYRAPTIGVTTSCEPITEKCQFGVWGADDAYSGFYCSSYFYGVLGKTAIIANDSTTTDDPDIPPLSSKISPNLQIAFFTDKDLEVPYNTRAYDLTTGKVNTSIPLLPDAELVNEVWVAIAGRVPTSALQADSELNGDPNFFMGPKLLLDSVIRCRYRSLDAEYTWFNGTVQNVQFQNSSNGTMSELYHGYRTPTSVSGSNPTLLDILSQAAMQATTAEFCRTWANLLSGEIMSVIGGVTTPRSNTLQQDRVPQLVVKIWVPSLVWLLLCCLLYPIAGIMLTTLAAETSREHYIGNAVSRVSLYGFAEQGFAGQHTGSVVEASTGEVAEDNTVRVGFGDDLHFKKWPMEVRSTTHVNGTGAD